ncbi:MAG TPA: four helix bundle protein [Gemmatimonadales bacterium]|nr:four helix bundle protein [Gemmatimonadales bacterium]HYT82836.1 four helix bundle protein [Gemmatimonadales bacterium]
MVLRAYARRLRVHELAVEVSVRTARLTRSLGGPGVASRADQLVRAALSISSNIAEACGRGTVPEFRQFLLYARGSAQETLTQLRVAAALDPAHSQAIRALENRVALILKMLGRLIDHPPPDR